MSRCELLKIFSVSLIVLFILNRNAAPQRKLAEIAMFAGQFCLLSYWLMAGICAFPSGFPIAF
jgi:hypothetical protein